ncbi:MAG TPA: AMP-binding protein [Candidatus Eisenbacteria bacterium]|nr:AMP-binding protein [Candidatus Eisenbacteria bacterium]
MTITDVLLARAPSDPAVVDEASGAVLDGAALRARVAGRTAQLRAAGVVAGDRVAILMPNSVAMVEALLATACAGAAAVPVNLRWTATEVTHLFRDATPRVLVSTTDALRAIAGLDEHPSLVDVAAPPPTATLPPPPARRDPALILYTSGTTGKPKGAVMTHANLVSNARRIAAWLDVGPADRVLTVMPLFHANAIVIGTLVPLVAGGATIVAERFRPSTFWSSVSRHRPTTVGTVPTMLSMLLGAAAPAAEDRASLRFILTGSAPVPTDVLLGFEARFGIEVIEGYGMTECTCRATFNPTGGRRRPGSCGLALEELRIVDEHDRDVPRGDVGEIVMRGPHVMQGYWNNPDATAHALRGGWLHSGDLARQDADGFVYIAGRASDMIIRGGENVYPREIEEVLHSHPDVAEAAVIGLPDALYGEVVGAFVAPHPDRAIDEAALYDWCAGRLADYKRPVRITVLPELPKGPTGKILKAPLRRRVDP